MWREGEVVAVGEGGREGCCEWGGEGERCVECVWGRGGDVELGGGGEREGWRERFP